MALVAFGLLLAGVFAVQVYRSGYLLYQATRFTRCRSCGALHKETSLVVFGIPIYENGYFCATRISELLQRNEGDRCVHGGELPVRTREVECTTGSFPWWRFSELKFGDVAGLPENGAFLEALATLSRTNLAGARALWSCLCRLDYRSSNVLARFYPSLTATNVTSVLAVVHSEPVFEFAERN